MFFTDADHERLSLMSGFFLPLVSAFFFSAHEWMLLSGERKIILFNL
jgi:hypothetical protein